jgi:hypothetical protein
MPKGDPFGFGRNPFTMGAAAAAADVALRRDVEQPFTFAAGAQDIAASSAPGSDSNQQAGAGGEATSKPKRGRGRQRKSTGIETAQQVGERS